MPGLANAPQLDRIQGRPSGVNLSTALIQMREAHAWTRSDVAARTGVSDSTVQRLENSQVTPRLSTLKSMLDALVSHSDGIELSEAQQIADAAKLRWRPPRGVHPDNDIKKSIAPALPPAPVGVETESGLIHADDAAAVMRLAIDLLIQTGPARTIAALESLIKATTKATPINAGRQASQQLRSISAPITRPDGATEHVIRTYDVNRIPPPAPAKKKAN